MTTTESSASTAHPSTPVTEEARAARASGTCSGCGTRAKTLTAPCPNVGQGYTGPMYCLHCNPRFFTLDAQWSSLERGWSANRSPLIARDSFASEGATVPPPHTLS
jgi:hypothetical protein